MATTYSRSALSLTPASRHDVTRGGLQFQQYDLCRSSPRPLALRRGPSPGEPTAPIVVKEKRVEYTLVGSPRGRVPPAMADVGSSKPGMQLPSLWGRQ